MGAITALCFMAKEGIIGKLGENGGHEWRDHAEAVVSPLGSVLIWIELFPSVGIFKQISDILPNAQTFLWVFNGRVAQLDRAPL